MRNLLEKGSRGYCRIVILIGGRVNVNLIFNRGQYICDRFCLPG